MDTSEHLDKHTHTHDMESFRMQKPIIPIAGVYKIGSSKRYSTAQINHAFRGVGTYEGSDEYVEKLERQLYAIHDHSLVGQLNLEG